jgi:hypothetical protein
LNIIWASSDDEYQMIHTTKVGQICVWADPWCALLSHVFTDEETNKEAQKVSKER